MNFFKDLKKINIKNLNRDFTSKYYLHFTHFNTYQYSLQQTGFIRIQKFSFSENKKTTYSMNDIKQKLENEGSVKIYESKYPFTSEKFLAQVSVVFLIISSTTIFMYPSLWVKAVNLIFVFTPSLAILIEVLSNNTRFVRNIVLLPDKKIMLTTLWGKKETLEIRNLIKAEDDQRFQKFLHSLNNSTFIIFANKQENALYHLPREGIFLNDDLVHDILEGKYKL
jgi:hypothetical protein